MVNDHACGLASMPYLRSHGNGSLKHLSAIHVLKIEGTSEGTSKSVSTRRDLTITAGLASIDDSNVSATRYASDGSEFSGIPSSPSPSAANIAPPEVLLQIFSRLTPRDFDNARRTCSQWMRVGMNRDILESMLKRAGWWEAYQQDIARQSTRPLPSDEESDSWKMSRRFATECLLTGRKSNIGNSGFVTTQVIDFSALSQNPFSVKTRRSLSNARQKMHFPSKSTFSVSPCSNYLLATTHRRIHVFQLLGRKSTSYQSTNLDDMDIIPITTIECNFEVISAVIDTTLPKFTIAALLESRVAMVCNLNLPTGTVKQQAPRMSKNIHSTPHYYYNVCSEDHPPRTIALSPGCECIAFGCAGGIEIHWVDKATQKDRRRHFPMSQPSETLHFLPTISGASAEMRLISSLAGPGTHECACRQSPYPDHLKKCQFNMLARSQSVGQNVSANTSSLSLVRATHCHHYRAVPINDGFHIIFVEPRTGFLCIGSDAPIGGPTSLSRAFICVPPPLQGGAVDVKETCSPEVFTVGADLNWGLRVVAVYQNRIVLYSVPLDVFSIIRKERERQGDGVMGTSDPARDWFVDPERCRKRRENLAQNHNGDWEFLLSMRYRPTSMMWPFKIYGKEIGKVENVVELALQSSNGGARIWAFSANGRSTVLDIDTFAPSSFDGKGSSQRCNFVTVGPDGSLGFDKENDSLDLGSSRKRKLPRMNDGFHGRYGASRFGSNVTSQGPPKSSEGLPSDSNSFPAANRDENPPIGRPSFAACIVDFKIPELGTRKGN